VKTVAIFVGGMAAGAGVLYFGMVAYLTADWWFPRRLQRRAPIEDLDLPDTDEEWGSTR
jgi:hypothetical protein